MARRANSIVPCGPAPAANDTERQSSARLDPLIDHVVNGRYRVKRVLARGGMGRVYFATQEPLGRAVALKVVRDDDEGAGEMRSHERFVLEADILARLQHPNIVTLFDFGTMHGPFAGQSFIAMELLGGETLAQRLQGGRRLPVADVLTIAAQISRGLRAAHDRGIVHRDLKPSNVMLVPDADGEEIVKLVDFGIGKLLWDASARSSDLTGVGGVVGTPQFMAPEQVEGQTLAAADVYAVGTIMFLALTGRLPFDAATTTETLKNKLSRAAPRLRDVAPELDVAPEIEDVVAALLARSPAERPSATALARALTRCLAALRPQSEIEAARPPSARIDTGGDALVSATSASLVPAASASAASSRPPSLARSESRASGIARLTPILVGALLTYAMVLVYVFGRRVPGLREEQASAVEPTAPAHGEVASGAGAGEVARSFTLALDSVPAGATVTEDGRALGATPLGVTVERASVADGPRRFVLHKAGYADMTVEQGPSREDTRMVVALARAAAPVNRAPSQPLAAPAPPAPPSVAASTAAPAPSAAPARVPTPSVQVFDTGK